MLEQFNHKLYARSKIVAVLAAKCEHSWKACSTDQDPIAIKTSMAGCEGRLTGFHHDMWQDASCGAEQSSF